MIIQRWLPSTVNAKAELEIELLHDKMNLLREQEIVELRTLAIQQQQIQRLEELLLEYQKAN